MKLDKNFEWINGLHGIPVRTCWNKYYINVETNIILIVLMNTVYHYIWCFCFNLHDFCFVLLLLSDNAKTMTLLEKDEGKKKNAMTPQAMFPRKMTYC